MSVRTSDVFENVQTLEVISDDLEECLKPMGGFKLSNRANSIGKNSQGSASSSGKGSLSLAIKGLDNDLMPMLPDRARP